METSILHPVMDRKARQKIKRELNQHNKSPDLREKHRTLYPTTAYTFSSAHTIHYMLGHKLSLKRFKKIDVIRSISLTQTG